MVEVIEQLLIHKEEKYAEFCAKLIPNMDRSYFIGVRNGYEREIAKELYKSGKYQEFLKELPHQYYEENMVHSYIISEIKDYDECINELEKYLPFMNNWSVCDCCKPKVFKKYPDKAIKYVKKWIKSKDTYTCRFGVDVLMDYYLDDLFKKEYLELPLKVKSSEYYINMAIAWYYATALAKQYDSTIDIIEKKKLDKWTHNKTIQKAIESYRITNEQKDYLRLLKIK